MPEVERAIAVLPRVRWKLVARRAADLPAEHRGDAIQTHHADGESCVECFKHLLLPGVGSHKGAKEDTKAQSEVSFVPLCETLCLCVKPTHRHPNHHRH